MLVYKEEARRQVLEALRSGWESWFGYLEWNGKRYRCYDPPLSPTGACAAPWLAYQLDMTEGALESARDEAQEASRGFGNLIEATDIRTA